MITSLTALVIVLAICLVAVIRYYRRELADAQQDAATGWRFYREILLSLDQQTKNLEQADAELDRAWRYNFELQHRLRDQIVVWDVADVNYRPTIYLN